MNVGVAHSDSNPNSSWMSGRGGWLSYAIAVCLIHLVIRIQPFLGASVVWTLTNVVHDIIMFTLLHTLKGAPWHNTDQGRSRRLTHWEQIDSGQQFTGTKKFLTLIPIVLFLITCYMTDYEVWHFGFNALACAFVLVPKLPQFHKVRLFDINKY